MGRNECPRCESSECTAQACWEAFVSHARSDEETRTRAQQAWIDAEQACKAAAMKLREPALAAEESPAPAAPPDLRSYLTALAEDVRSAQLYQRKQGGMSVGPPELGACPPSALKYLERMLRAALDGASAPTAAPATASPSAWALVERVRTRLHNYEASTRRAIASEGYPDPAVLADGLHEAAGWCVAALALLAPCPARGGSGGVRVGEDPEGRPVDERRGCQEPAPAAAPDAQGGALRHLLRQLFYQPVLVGLQKVEELVLASDEGLWRKVYEALQESGPAPAAPAPGDGGEQGDTLVGRFHKTFGAGREIWDTPEAREYVEGLRGDGGERRGVVEACVAVHEAWRTFDEALGIYFDHAGPYHADGCPGDDTCACEHLEPLHSATPKMQAAMMELGDLLRIAATHPSAEEEVGRG